MTADAATIEAILATIRGKESGGNYTVKNKYASASGAYQFVDGTWRDLTRRYGIGTQYRSAKTAPPQVQDAVARRYAADILRRHGGDVSVIPRVWYTGKNTKGTAADNVVPYPQYGNKETPAQYAASWLRRFNQNARKGGQGVAQVVADTSTGVRGQAAAGAAAGAGLFNGALGPSFAPGGAPVYGSAPAGGVDMLDMAALMRGAQAWGQQGPGELPDIEAIVADYQQGQAEALAAQVEDIKAAQKDANSRLKAVTLMLDQQRGRAVTDIASARQRSMTALQSNQTASLGAQQQADAQSAAGRASMGFAPNAASAPQLGGIADAGIAALQGGYSDLDAQMAGDIAELSRIIAQQGEAEQGTAALQAQALARRAMEARVGDFEATLQRDRLGALTEFGLEQPQRVLQMLQALTGIAGANQDAQLTQFGEQQANWRAQMGETGANYRAQLGETGATYRAELQERGATARAVLGEDRADARLAIERDVRARENDANWQRERWKIGVEAQMKGFKVQPDGSVRPADGSGMDSRKLLEAMTPTEATRAQSVLAMVGSPDGMTAAQLAVGVNTGQIKVSDKKFRESIGGNAETLARGLAAASFGPAGDPDVIDPMRAYEIIDRWSQEEAKKRKSSKASQAEERRILYGRARDMYDQWAMHDNALGREYVLDIMNRAQVQREALLTDWRNRFDAGVAAFIGGLAGNG